MSVIIDSHLFKSDFIESKVKSDKLMIVLHGKGDSLIPFKHFDSELKLRNINYLLLNAPKKFMGGYSWYNEPPKMRHQVIEVRKRMLAVLQQLYEKGWRPENIFLFGFSQGALVSADLALNIPYKLAGVIGVSGYFHFYPRWRTCLKTKAIKTPWLFTHGLKDDILPVEISRFGAKKLKSVGFDVEWIELNKRHDLKEEEYPLIRNWILKKLNAT
jgi:phospholipase/carboxylesterase